MKILGKFIGIVILGTIIGAVFGLWFEFATSFAIWDWYIRWEVVRVTAVFGQALGVLIGLVYWIDNNE